MYFSFILAVSLLPEQASEWALQVDYVFGIITAICAISFLLVEGILVFLVLKYRRKKNEKDRKTPFITHNVKLEVIWTIIPTLVMFVVFYYGAVTYYQMRTLPKEYLQIDVVGRQWSWKFVYSNGITANTQSVCTNAEFKNQLDCEVKGYSWKQGEPLVVPINQKIVLRMNSKDVLHSFYVPAFRVKQDVVPGMTSKLWFIANRIGTYDIFCTEYCGLDHSGMIGKVTVKPIEEYKAWLTKVKKEQEKAATLIQDPAQMVALGKELFLVKKGCVACHRLDGKRLVGPPLNGIFGKTESLTNGSKITVDENYLYESIMDPSAKIVKEDPPYPTMNAQDVNEIEAKAIVEFLKGCKNMNCGG